MARTLQDILISANAYLSLDATIPSGTDLTTWSNYADFAVREAAETARFDAFNLTQITATSGGINYATLASIPLASNFREFLSAPKVNLGGGVYQEYPQIDPPERFAKGDEYYCYVLGSPSEGYTAVFNKLTANATISMDYQRYPSGLLTLTDQCELPDDTYVVEKIKSYVLQARTDERFPSVDANANRKLRNMIGRQSRRPTGGVNTTPKANTTFRIGV